MQENRSSTLTVLVLSVAMMLALPLLALAQPSTAAAAADSDGPFDAWYLVFEADRDGVVELRSSHRVQLDASPTRERRDDEPSLPGAGLVRVELSDASGALVHEEMVRVPEVVRGEFHGERAAAGHYAIESHLFRPERRAFVVRAPAVENGTLVIDDGDRTSSFALADVAERAQRVPARASVERVQSAGRSSNRVDLAILGDGYRQDQEGTFLADAAALANDFLAITPYREYRNLVNVTTLFSPSVQSGADHPPYDANCAAGDVTCCGDVASQSDPLAGTFVDTVFDGRFCAFNIQRLAVVDSTKVLAAAAAIPDWDRILVVLNDETYGGSGGFVSVTSTNEAAVDIARHEYGHSFTGLADEYDAITPGYPECSDRTGPDCEPNVTDETNRSMVKWESWIAAATPVPTPETPAFANAVGVFEGARYRPEGMFRPRDRCLMNVLGVDFGEICREEYVIDLYRGGWGEPSAGIDLIEPGSTRPTGSQIEYAGSPVRFSADLLQPVGAPPIDVVWTVDGAVAATGADSFDFTPPGPGSFEVVLTVRDTTPFVLPENAAELESRRRWTVTSNAGAFDCEPDESTLCLEDGRFQVTVAWSDFEGGGGSGSVVPVDSEDSGLFTFFDPDNWEMLIKVLDACGTNDRFWVFLAATTNLGYTVTVTDSETGAIRAYENPAGNRAPAVTDTDAFATCQSGAAPPPEPRPATVRLDQVERHPSLVPMADAAPRPVGAAANPCVDGVETLCLNRSRFEVEVAWRDFAGGTGGANVVPFRSDDSGLFYIFDPDNWELLVKVLDACALNGHYWVFGAATTNIEFTLTVRDSATGAVSEYTNPLGQAAAAITDTTAFPFCP